MTAREHLAIVALDFETAADQAGAGTKNERIYRARAAAVKAAVAVCDAAERWFDADHAAEIPAGASIEGVAKAVDAYRSTTP